MFNLSLFYSLRKSRQIMKSSYKWYRKEGQKLSPSELALFESKLQALDEALLNRNREEADSLAKQLETFCDKHFKKKWWVYLSELLFAIMLALMVAILIRQMWFELYEIPTGSMRPTFEEQDHLTVTKTAFGINTPLMTSHLYFDPKLVQRAGIVIWSGDGIPYLNSDSTFMGLFPYTKRYIKRCLGKPGDTLYFYGGKIYGFDAEGHDLLELRQDPRLDKLEHIPFINFDGQRTAVQEPKQTFTTQVVFNQMNKGIGRLQFLPNGEIRGEIFNGKNWIADHPEAQKHAHNTLQTYSDFWGIRNFAMARLLTKKQVETLTSFLPSELEPALLYLELRHTPSLNFPKPVLTRHNVFLKPYTTLIPLQERHLKALMENMYTARFVVKDGKAARYNNEGTHFSASSPSFPLVPDGTYEFYYGKASEINWSGIAFSLPPDHPLYQQTPENVQKLFNIGVELSNEVAPRNSNQVYFPYRYAYFREGDLFSLGGVVIKKEDPTLQDFLKREKRREEQATALNPYVAFKDYGPPVHEDGQLNKDFIETFGLKIPDNHYLVLGDNHAMSQDSRAFGPIPQANLQGAPSLIIWPPGDRWGRPNQQPYPLITVPRLIIWGIAGTIAAIWFLLYRRRLKQPIFKKYK